MLRVETDMRINTAKSIDTANMVYGRYGSWKAVKDASTQRDGKFVVASNSAEPRTAARPKVAGLPKTKADSPAESTK